MAQVNLDGGGAGAGGTTVAPARSILLNPTNAPGVILQFALANTPGHTLVVQADGSLASAAPASSYIGTYTAIANRDFDLTSLPGNAFTGYDIYLRGSASASGTFDILLNGSDTCDATHYLVAAGTAVSADENFGPGVISATAHNVVHIRIWTKTGLRRRCQVRSDGVYSGQQRLYHIAGEWADTAAVITQLRLRLGVSDTWTAGTIAEVWGF